MAYTTDFLIQILDQLNVGVFVLDAEGNYLYVNESYSNLFDREPEYFMNMSIPKMKELRYLSTSVWEQVIQRKAPVTALMTIVHKEFDRVYHHFTTGIPSFYEDGSIQYIFYLVEQLDHLNQRIQEGVLNQQYFLGLNEIIRMPDEGIIAQSPQMKKLLSLLSNISKTDASVLLTGPTGSGKQVLAEYTHRTSMRSKGPFVCIDCTAIPETLLESELFGYKKGSFTGASTQGKKGLIELADGGTLFLDEINSMPLGLQSKLLHVLETKQVRRIGASDFSSIDFRLICASNECLETLVKDGRFRSDLYYRINVIPAQVPPLRERKEDIIQLSFLFMRFFCNKYTCVKVLSDNVLNAMLDYDWPGNVRELRNCIERIVASSPSAELEIDTFPDWLNNAHLTHEIQLPKQMAMLPDRKEECSFHDYMEQYEKQLIHTALKNFKTPARVAEALKLDLSNVYRKMKKYGLHGKEIYTQ